MSAGGVYQKLADPHASAATLSATWFGYVRRTKDALVLFEAALQGRIRFVHRRPHDRERDTLITSGNVFIYEEGESGIKRWTDGLPWSPSRMNENFLLYRELDKPPAPGEKKRASKKRRNSGSENSYPRLPRSNSFTSNTTPPTPSTAASSTPENVLKTEQERELFGSLTDSYDFKQGGLMKKTISVSVSNAQLHLVSYYNPQDVTENRLPQVSEDETLAHIQYRDELVNQNNFKTPLAGMESKSPPAGRGYDSMSGHFPPPSAYPEDGIAGYLQQQQYQQHPAPASSMYVHSPSSLGATVAAPHQHLQQSAYQPEASRIGPGLLNVSIPQYDSYYPSMLAQPNLGYRGGYDGSQSSYTSPVKHQFDLSPPHHGANSFGVQQHPQSAMEPMVHYQHAWPTNMPPPVRHPSHDWNAGQ